MPRYDTVTVMHGIAVIKGRAVIERARGWNGRRVAAVILGGRNSNVGSVIKIVI
jgi:hypothetical protein